ncbi:hypothetical protein Cgig2_011103 [Carnegiea gigantea]|uniref:Uncharacterized protein n=1 Tax=Carnegiea gigantea TaxID=171969 RepID=A0A9Q1Q7S2_9CARY|nr:hypothetical protein Cgig2_011103 [Carnegiea gigantea]
MSSMADAITRQVSEQVRRATEAASSVRPHPSFDYPLVHQGKPSHRPKGILSPATRNAAGKRHPMLWRPPTMAAPPKPQNDRKNCELHEQIGHTTIECRELKKALHELADKGQIDRFLKRGPRFLRREQEPAPPPPRDEECSTEVVAIIARGYVKGITQSAWKAQLRNAQQEVNPTGMIHLPVRFGNKIKSNSLEIDFLVVDVPTAYNKGTGGRPTQSPPPDRLGNHGPPLHCRPMKLRSPQCMVNTVHPGLKGSSKSATALSALDNEKRGHKMWKSSGRGRGGHEALLQRQMKDSLT